MKANPTEYESKLLMDTVKALETKLSELSVIAQYVAAQQRNEIRVLVDKETQIKEAIKSIAETFPNQSGILKSLDELPPVASFFGEKVVMAERPRNKATKTKGIEIITKVVRQHDTFMSAKDIFLYLKENPLGMEWVKSDITALTSHASRQGELWREKVKVGVSHTYYFGMPYFYNSFGTLKPEYELKLKAIKGKL